MPETKIINGVMHAVIIFIFNDLDQVLMFNRYGEEWERGWEPVKGKVHVGETDEAAALREVHEEAGLRNITVIRYPHYFPAKKPWNGGFLPIRSAIFVCGFQGGEIKLGEVEHIGFEWMGVDEAKEKIWIDHGKEILTKAFEFYKK